MVLPLIVTGATQVPPGTMLKTEPKGNWSFKPTSVLTPTLPPGWVTRLSTASMMLAVTVVTLLAWVAGAVSLVAPVVAVKVTAVSGSSAPPAVPGAV